MHFESIFKTLEYPVSLLSFLLKFFFDSIEFSNVKLGPRNLDCSKNHGYSWSLDE